MMQNGYKGDTANARSFLLFLFGMLFLVVLEKSWTQIGAFLQQELNPVALLIVFIGLETHRLRTFVNCSGHISREFRGCAELRQEIWTSVLAGKPIRLCNLARRSCRVPVWRYFSYFLTISVCLLILSPFGLAAFFLRFFSIVSIEYEFFLGDFFAEELPHLFFHVLLIFLISSLSISFALHLFVNSTDFGIDFTFPNFVSLSKASDSPEFFLGFVLRILLRLINNIVIMVVMNDSLC